MVDVRLERTLRRDAEPEVPVKRVGHRVRPRRTVEPLRPDRTVRRNVDLAHLAQHAALENLDVAALSVRAVAVVAHLRDDAARFRHLAKTFRLPPRTHEGLLHVDVAAALHRRDGAGGVHVVRRGDDHGVEALLAFEQVAPDLVGAHLRVGLGHPLGGAVETFAVHVAERHDLLAQIEELAEVRPAAPAAADERHADLVARLAETGRTQDRHGRRRAPGLRRRETSRHGCAHGGHHSATDELST